MTLIKFNGNEENWQCVDNMKNELLKEWILDNAAQILTEDEVKTQYNKNQEFFTWGVGGKSRINDEYAEVYELMQIFIYKDYDDIKEETVEYNKFFWANYDEIKKDFEPNDFMYIINNCYIR